MRYKYSSWKGGSICLESSAESREYMLTYFWGKGTYFYWGDGSISGKKWLKNQNMNRMRWSLNLFTKVAQRGFSAGKVTLSHLEPLRKKIK